MNVQCFNAKLEPLRFVELVKASSWITRQIRGCKYTKLYFGVLVFLACAYTLSCRHQTTCI